MEILNWQRGYGKTFRVIQESKTKKFTFNCCVGISKKIHSRKGQRC